MFLTCLEKARCAQTQRELAKQTGVSLGTINKTVTSLEALGYVDEAGITENGLEVWNRIVSAVPYFWRQGLVPGWCR